jgi:transcriptional regulator of acetoin/glycerol metabolism
MHDRNPPAALRPVIQQSWKRSRAAGVDPRPQRLRLRKVSKYELAARLDLNRNLLAAAKPRLETFSGQLSGIQHVLYVLDSDGIVLFSAGEERLRQTYGLQSGYDWSERQMGTNGAGTALATGQPLTVMGEEHYCELFRAVTCMAAPIIGPFGRVVGAIDLTTSVADAVLDRLTQMIQLAHEIGEELMRAGGQRQRARARGAKRGAR